MHHRLLLLDDHPALMRGLAAVLSQEPDMEVSAQLGSGEALLSWLEAHPEAADLLLLDLHLPPPHDGLSLLPQLRRDWPELRVLVFSSASAPGMVAQAASAGAHGFLDKSAEADELLTAIRAVCRGETVFPGRHPSSVELSPAPTAEPEQAPATLALDAQARLRALSARELEVLGLVRQGLSTRSIASQLSLSEFTVSTHRRNLMQKLGVQGLGELLRFAHEYGA